MENKPDDLAILILAAGSSSRLGRPKQLLEIHGKTLLQKTITSALQISKNVNVVLGAHAELIYPTITAFPINIMLNENWVQGMSSSICTGMSFLGNVELDAILILLSDQPFVDEILLQKMVATFHQNNQKIIAAEYENKVGVPAIFPVQYFPKLKNLTGQQGAKSLIMNDLEQVERVMFEKGKIDIDTEEDWEKFKKSSKKG